MQTYLTDLYIYFASYIFLMAYYGQYQSILHYHRVPARKFMDCYNVDLMEAQIKGLKLDISNKYYFWSLLWSFIFIACVTAIAFPEKSVNLMVFTCIILAVQYVAEYIFFLLPLATESEEKELSAKKVLNKKEKITTYKNVELTYAEKKRLYQLKDHFRLYLIDSNHEIKKKTENTINNLDVSLKELFVEKITKNKEELTIKLSCFKSYQFRKEFLLEFKNDEFQLEEIIEKDSNYVSSFYEIITIERIYLYGYIEPVFASAILYYTLKF